MNTRNRRGNIAVLVALMTTGLVAVSAVSLDATRLLSFRNELQFSADAGAHAGAIQLVEPNDPTYTADTAAAYATRYLSMQRVVRVDSVELGGWDDFNHVFQPGMTPFTAVRIVVSQRPGGLLVSHFGVTAPRLRATAVGWVQHDSLTAVRKIVLAQ